MTRLDRHHSVASPVDDLAASWVSDLTRTHGAALLAFASSRIPDRRDAEEVVQETLVRAWRYQASFDPNRGLERMWLFGICRNVVSDRRHQLARSANEVGDLPVDIATGDDTARLAEASFVADVLRRLSPEHQEVVVRAVLNGESTREIAMGIGVPAGTVKSRLHYGLRALRALLEAEGILR